MAAKTEPTFYPTRLLYRAFGLRNIAPYYATLSSCFLKHSQLGEEAIALNRTTAAYANLSKLPVKFDACEASPRFSIDVAEIGKGCPAAKGSLKRQGYTIWTFAWGRKDDGAPDELAFINLVPARHARSACALPH